MNPPRPTPWKPACALALLLASSLAHAAGGTPPVFTISPDSLHADENGTWHATLSIENKGTYGLYPDSLSLEWKSDDPDSTAAPHAGITSLNGLVRAIGAASAGESSGMQWTSPANFSRGTLVFHLVTHDGQKNVFNSSLRVVVTGSYLEELYPGESIKLGSQVVDVVVMPADTSARPAPGLLYVPPAGTSARGAMRAMVALRSQGTTIAIVSLPGSGRSSGRADRAGPTSVAAVDAALARLARDPSVDPKRIGIWGENEGATSALLASVRHPELQALVAQDASCDPWAAYRALPADQRASFVREAGTDSAGWRARSPLLVARKIVAPVLMFQSSGSGVADSSSAVAFVQARGDSQLFIESRIGGHNGRPLARRDALRVGQDFLNRRLRHP